MNMDKVKEKTSKVMSALKDRGVFQSKKGVSLLGIVQKLTEKRKAMGESEDTKSHESMESPADKTLEKAKVGKN